jgi:tRNA (guanine26-N2/guanine27-N2)-dimethyltransferase
MTGLEAGLVNVLPWARAPRHTAPLNCDRNRPRLMTFPVQTVVEGDTKLFVPKASLLSSDPPTTPAFFNPAAAPNRDLSVCVAASSDGSTFCDSLAGVGARGVRVAHEVKGEISVTLLDFNSDSLKLARKSARSNGVADTCTAIDTEANTFLFSRFRRDQKFDFVDVDPFGTPVPYLQGAFNATAAGGMVSVTATDTAVLCGVYPGVAKRRYGTSLKKTEYSHEQGLRALAAACVRTAAINDLGAWPVLGHSTRNYIRLYFRIKVGAQHADAALMGEGFILDCAKCGNRATAEKPEHKCPACGANLRPIGPLWIGPFTDASLVERARKEADRRGMLNGAKILRSLDGVADFPPYSFSLERICSLLKLPGVSPFDVGERLVSQGYLWMRQPFDKTGIKTWASYAEVVEAVKSASGVAASPAPERAPRHPVHK